MPFRRLRRGMDFGFGALEAEGLGVERHIAADEHLQTVIEEVDAAGGGIIKPRRAETTIAPAERVVPTTTGNRVVLQGLEIDTTPTSASGQGSYIDFTSAPNLSYRDVTILGEHSTGGTWATVAGDGFRWYDLTIDGGSGGVWVDGVSDVRGVGLNATNLHDTSTGTGAGLVVAHADNVHTWGHRFENTDRGLEVEEGATRSSFRSGVVVGADNSAASTPEVQKSVEVTRHATEPDIEDVLIEDWTVSMCASGPRVQNNDPDGTIDATVRDLTLVDTPGLKAQGDTVLFDTVDIYIPTITVEKGVQWTGGNVTVRDLTIHDPVTSNSVHVSSGPLPHGTGRFDSPRMNAGAEVTSRYFRVDASLGAELVITDPKGFGDASDRGISVSDGGLSGDGYGLVLRNPRLSMTDWNPTYAITKTGNDPVLIDGGWNEHGIQSLPNGSRINGVKGADQTDVGDGVVVDGLVTESGTADTPSGTHASPGDLIEYDDTDDDTGDGTYLKQSDGSIVQLT